MSTRSSVRNLFPTLDNPEHTIRRRSRADPTLLNDFEMVAEENGDPPVPDLRTLEELCQPSLNGRGDDANKHLDKFLHVTQSIKVNGVTDEALHLYLFLDSLTHHTAAWFDSLPRNSINTFEQMAKMFLEKYFPPSMVTKLRNEITNFYQCLDESLFEAWERYKLSIDQCGTFMKRRLEECYDLIENMTAHHNDWDTSAQRSELSSSITSSFDTKIVALKAKMEKINKNLMRILQVNRQVKAVTPNYETCCGPHSYNDCLATVGQTQNVYATGAYQGNSYQPQGNRNLLSYHSDNYLRPPGFNQNQNETIRIITSITKTGIKETIILRGTIKGETNSSKELVMVQTRLQLIKLRANDAILKNIQTNMTSLTNSNLKLKNMFGQFMKMNTASSSGSRTLLCNTITNPKEDLKGITTRCGNAYQGTTIPTTSSSLPHLIERETEVTKDMMHLTNNESTKDVQPPVVQVETLIPNSELVVAPIIKPVVAPVSALKPNLKPSIPYPYSTNYNDMTVNRIDVIDMDCEEYSQEVLGFSDVIASGNPTPYYDPIVSTSSTTLTPFGDSDFLLEEVDAFLSLKDDPTSPKELKICEAKIDKSSIDEPLEVKLKHLPPHLEYVFLEGEDKLPVIIAKDLSDEEKTAFKMVLKSHRRAIAWKLSDIKDQQKTTFMCPYGPFSYRRMPFGLCNALGTFQRCMMAIFQDMIEKTMEVFIDDFSIFRNSFETCLSLLEKMLKWCEDTNHCLNWEKSHFMVKEGIILGHKISKNGIEVDKAKVNVIAKLPHPTTIKGIRSFLGHAGFYRRFIQDFSKIARPITRLLEKDTPFFFSKECVEAFQTLKRKLTEAPILIPLIGITL
nr:reverse transcriptase domain-containing protein [Tanacetum cinerariifolium]